MTTSTPTIDSLKDPLVQTEYQRSIGFALSAKLMGHGAQTPHNPIYQGFGPDIIHLPRAPHGPGEVGRLEGHQQPDPRIAQVERRRAKNRVARKSRRANRIASNR
ncbi:hypothetical protein [Williamsia soli]|uniref:hypothetical protein n=1 Tax=Williamsia soli TaxID=364929 RepID=UPI001A9F4F80|nr:hypothetical protein [Williamsia soli]